MTAPAGGSGAHGFCLWISGRCRIGTRVAQITLPASSTVVFDRDHWP